MTGGKREYRRRSVGLLPTLFDHYDGVGRGRRPTNDAGKPGVSSHSMERLLGKANRLENMRIREITLQEIGMKLVAPFETSMDRTVARRIMLVQADVDGVIGWGECVAGETPYYSPETADTAWLILRDFLWPLIKGKDFGSAGEVWELLARVRGHNMTKAGLEAAVWDAEAKQKGVPLAKLIGGVREEIACGVSIGIKESLDELSATVQRELAAGYQRIKIKIKPGKDLELV